MYRFLALPKHMFCILWVFGLTTASIGAIYTNKNLWSEVMLSKGSCIKKLNLAVPGWMQTVLCSTSKWGWAWLAFYRTSSVVWNTELGSGNIPDTWCIWWWWWWLFPRVPGFFGECSTIHSPPALTVEISLHTLIPLFRLGTVHSGSASWDDCDRVFPGELHASSFPDRFPHCVWTAAYDAFGTMIMLNLWFKSGLLLQM